MRFAPLTSTTTRFIGANIATTSSSSRFSAGGRNPWRRGFCDRPPPGINYRFGDWSARDANYGFRHQHQHQFRPPDFRDWNYSLSQPHPHSERFIVLSYNILADYLAREHRAKLYLHIPHHILDWEWRKRRLLIEFGLWNPDIMCLQEVDRFHDLKEELAIRGYTGIWKMRTGNAVDGCAVFWRTNRFHLRHEEHIEFSKFGLRDNIAQICVLESTVQYPVENTEASLLASSHQSRGANQVVLCNIHVLYNPKRGEIKLGQVRMLLDRANAVSRIWNDAPVVACGDFNSTPKSPLYNFISGQKLSLSGLARDQVSGQSSTSIYAPRPYGGSAFYRTQPYIANSNEKTIGAKQDSCCTGSHSGFKHQNDLDNASPTEKFPTEHSGIPSNMGNDVKEPTVAMSCLSDHCFEGIQQKDGGDETIHANQNTLSEHGPQSDRNTVNEENDGNWNPNSGKSTLDFLSNIAFEGVVVDPSLDKLIDGDANATSPINTVFTICSANAEEPNIHNAPASSISSLDMKSGDISINEVSNPVIEDASTDVDHGTVNSSVTNQECMDAIVSSHTTNYYGKSVELNPVKGSQSQHKSASVNCLYNDLLEDNVSVSQDGSVINDLCSSEENSDPDFFKELLGAENPCEYSGEIMSTSLSDQIQSSSAISVDEAQRTDSYLSTFEIQKDSSLLINPYTSHLQKHYYNPYLWTPMEIEAASGSPECTVIEHNMKLRSTYTDVEDYAGTKDLSREPYVTSYNKQFMGTVDYIWCSEDLQTVKVLDTIPKHVLRRTPGFPTHKWGSDHIALVCQLAFTRGFPTK